MKHQIPNTKLQTNTNPESLRGKLQTPRADALRVAAELFPKLRSCDQKAAHSVSCGFRHANQASPGRAGRVQHRLYRSSGASAALNLWTPRSRTGLLSHRNSAACSNAPTPFEFWSLVFVWILVFGIWCFARRQSPEGLNVNSPRCNRGCMARTMSRPRRGRTAADSQSSCSTPPGLTPCSRLNPGFARASRPGAIRVEALRASTFTSGSPMGYFHSHRCFSRTTHHVSRAS